MKKSIKQLTPEDADEKALDAIRNGAASDGAVASKAGIGVTAAYQAVKRLVERGEANQATDGALSIAKG